MNVSITRFSAVFVLAAQWVAVAYAIRVVHGFEKIFADFKMQLPLATALALHLTRPVILVSLSALLTLFVVALEWRLKSETARFIVQIVNFCFWAVFVSFCLATISITLADLITALQ